MALHAVDASGEMLESWDHWSRSCPDKYRDGECARKWSSFDGNGVSLGTLIHMARQDGWTHPGQTSAADRNGHTRTAHRNGNGNGRAAANGQPHSADDGESEEDDGGGNAGGNGAHAPAGDQDAAHLTDRGNAIRLAREHGEDIRHVHPWRKWLCWDGRRWRVDAEGAVNLRAKRMIAAMFRRAAEEVQAIAAQLEAMGDDGGDEE